jgi:hypothetical protein
MSDLQVLFPNREITINDELISVKPLKIGQLTQAVQLSRNIIAPASELLASGDMASAAIRLIAEGGDDFLSLVGLSIGKTRAWFDDVEMDDGVAVAAIFLEVNLSFFVQRVRPILMKAMADLTKVADGAKL